MNEQRSYRYLIYSLFLLSGVSGLVYQIVWTRMLVLVFGNTMLATSTVLSAFMGGLAAGSYVLGRYIDRRPRPLIQVYAVLEAGIGIFGLLFPFVIDAVAPIYASLYSGVEGNIVLLNLVRFSVCFVIIVVPTFLMGGTLPVLIKRFSGPGGSIGHQTGFLYGLNTVGAVIGTFACGYLMLRLLGMEQTTWVAVAINLGVAIVAWFLGRRKRESAAMPVPAEAQPRQTYEAEQVYGRATIRMVLLGIGFSGFCALAYEVFWTRMLNLFLHNNIYSFTAILGTFLIGIAFGSLVYARFLSRSVNQLKLFVGLQIGIGVISFATPFIFSLLHGRLFNNFDETLTLAKTAIIMIGPTIMMGIAVPLAIQICRRGVNREGTSVGSVYAVNTVGAILGAFVAGFILLPTVGLLLGVTIVASLNILAGFLPMIASTRARLRSTWIVTGAVVIILMVVIAPSDLFRGLFQRAHPHADILYYKEGKVANILVYDFKKLGYKDFHLNAVNEASSRLWHVQLFKMLGLLPTVLHDNPSDALMVAFGAGMSAGACATNVESLDCVDLNPDIQGVAAAYTRENLDVINRDNFNQIVNDGRNALRLSDRQYSLIISDATNPKMFDSWTLYSQEFYQLVKSRLKPGGIFCQWALIPLPGDAIKVILNTFRGVFPHMSFWIIHGSTQVLMLGTPDRLEIDYEELAERLEPLYERSDLAEFGIDSPEKFLSFFTIGEDGIAKMLEGFDKISTDDLPHAQFYIEQDVGGIDNCLDLVRYQESIRNYVKDTTSLPAEFDRTMAAYEDIARRLNIGFLTNTRIPYAEAEVVAANAGIDDPNVAHMLNHCPEKKRHFGARLKDHPDDANAHNSLGNIYLLDGELDRAEQEFATAVELKPDYAFARMNLALTKIEKGDYDEAVADLLAVRELSPTKQFLGAVDHQLKRVRLLRKLSYQPESAELMRALGITLYNEGDLLGAIKAYRLAGELSDYEPSVIYNLARICENHEFVDEAARLYDTLTKIAPGQVELASKRVQYASLSNNPMQERSWRNGRLKFAEQAEKAETVVESDRHPESCDQALAIWNGADPEGSADTAAFRRAAELYVNSTRVKPDDIHAYIDAALLFEVLSEYDKSVRLWDDAAKLRPDAVAFARNANRLRSMANLKKTPAESPERASLLHQVAMQFRAVDQPERAMVYLREAVEIDPSREMVWVDLARTAAETGDYSEAKTAAQQALTRKPGLPDAESILKALEPLE